MVKPSAEVQAAAREVAVGPIRGSREQENGHSKNLEVHGKAPEFNVGTAR